MHAWSTFQAFMCPVAKTPSFCKDLGQKYTTCIWCRLPISPYQQAFRNACELYKIKGIYSGKSWAWRCNGVLSPEARRIWESTSAGNNGILGVTAATFTLSSVSPSNLTSTYRNRKAILLTLPFSNYYTRDHSWIWSCIYSRTSLCRISRIQWPWISYAYGIASFPKEPGTANLFYSRKNVLVKAFCTRQQEI